MFSEPIGYKWRENVLDKRARHHKINYIEFAATNLEATKKFFNDVFGWEFTDYGPEYTAYEGRGIDCGFYQSEKVSDSSNGAALPVFYSENLEESERRIIRAGGTIVREIFDFPGGRRFQFREPSGNELGVWSDIS
ncbi:MAG: VOC family protein [Alphaproteobacteria bacterium]|nr:VOC family protein [Alphaproteobacteria bacterium]